MTNLAFPETTGFAAASAGGVAVVFPGQGSQRPQMAQSWQDAPAFTRWAEADEVLGRDVTHLGLSAGADELREPANCQVALFVHHAVIHESWRRAGGSAAVTAGHSLGEYNALVAAGVLDFADALRLVDVRATATQAAAIQRPGGMLACLGGDEDAVRAACREAGAHIANDNAPGQLVVSGTDDALRRVAEQAAAARAKAVRLDVGAAYHSPHMEPAVETLGAALDATVFRDTHVPVVANADAQLHTAAGDWPALLRTQLTSPVRWRATVATMAAAGVEEVVELGAAPVLTGLVKRAAPKLRRRNVNTPDHLAAS